MEPKEMPERPGFRQAFVIPGRQNVIRRDSPGRPPFRRSRPADNPASGATTVSAAPECPIHDSDPPQFRPIRRANSPREILSFLGPEQGDYYKGK